MVSKVGKAYFISISVKYKNIALKINYISIAVDDREVSVSDFWAIPT